MVLNLQNISFGSIALLFLISCNSGGKNVKNSKFKPTNQEKACKLDLGATESIELHVGCANCHTYDADRQFPNVPTYAEIANIDSLKLSNFIFETRHNGYFSTDTLLSNHNNKVLDTLDECEKRNLLHFIKNNSRHIPQVLKTSGDTSYQ